MVHILSCELIFGTFHFVRGEKKPAYSPSCLESNFFNLVKEFDAKGHLASSDDFDELHCNGTKNLIKGGGKKVFFTFDDGYIEHYDYCADVLEQFNSRGLYFPVIESLVKRTVLDVNVIQLICSIKTYFDIAKEWLNSQELAGNPLIDSTDFSPAVFDDSIIQYVKRNLQGSPELIDLLEADTRLISKIKDEHSEFFESLYFNYDQACDLQSRGHIIGGHGDSHKWLTKLQPDNLSFELTSSLNLIKDINKDKKDFNNFFCYPYGLTNKEVSMKSLNHFDYCFTTEFGVLTSNKVREIPRVDVNLLRDFL